MLSFLPWLDLLWIPVALLVIKRVQWIFALGFLAACMFMMRLEVELMGALHYPRGMAGWLSFPVFSRGLVVYSVFYVIFLVLALFSPYARGAVMMAAAITLFFAAAFTSMIIMVL